MAFKRSGLFWLLIIFFFWLVASRISEIQQLAQTLAQGQWQWVLVAFLLAIAYFIARTAVYQSAFSTVEVESSLRGLLPLLFSSLFVNVAVPSLGASGMSLFVDDASKRGQSPARTAAGVLLFQIIDLASFALVLVVGFVYLLVQRDLHAYQIIGAMVLAFLILIQVGVLLLGLWRPGRLLVLFSAVQRAVNGLAGRLRRRPFLGEEWARVTADEFSEASGAIAAHPYRLGRALGLALAAQGLQFACLLALFVAFRQPLGLGALVAGFAVGVLFWIISITPQGIGVVEGVMTLVYTSLGVPALKAALITLAFRGLSFWLPLGVGFLTLRGLKSFRRETPSPADPRSVLAAMTLASLAGVAGIYTETTQALPRLLPWAAELLANMGVRHGGYLAAALSGVTLLMLAGDLIKRD
jgi:uncharacterized protein (TIRG00374 family)